MTTLTDLLKACQLEDTDHAQEIDFSAWNNWLTPLSDEDGVGEDPTYDDDYLKIREEVNQLSGVDTELICKLSENILTNVSKDLRVVTFYIWARLHQEGELGFAQGLELLAAMMHTFKLKLHPQRTRSRKTALEWLSSDRILNSLSLYPEVDIELTQRITLALSYIIKECEAHEETFQPHLSELYKALDTRLAQSGGVKSMIPQNTAQSDMQSTRNMPTQESITLSPVVSGRDLLDQAKYLAKYLNEQSQGWLAARHLMTSVRWDTLTQLPQLDASGRTRLSPPKAEHKAHLKRLYLQQNWQELLELTDSLFAQGIHHLWLDLQWYTWQARQQLDPNTIQADIICADLKALLTRLPELENLCFNDGTPFADEVTLAWIEKDVLDDIQIWQSEPVQVTSGESDVLALESEVIAKADESGIESALSWLQEHPSMVTPKDKWLMRLLMVRVTEQYGKNDMALHLLGELDNNAQNMTLSKWSPELIFEVKARRLQLLRMKVSHSEADRSRLQPSIDTLLAGLIELDPARAAVLCG